jgi:hypothetical protein
MKPGMSPRFHASSCCCIPERIAALSADVNTGEVHATTIGTSEIAKSLKDMEELME